MPGPWTVTFTQGSSRASLGAPGLPSRHCRCLEAGRTSGLVSGRWAWKTRVHAGTGTWGDKEGDVKRAHVAQVQGGRPADLPAAHTTRGRREAAATGPIGGATQQTMRVGPAGALGRASRQSDTVSRKMRRERFSDAYTSAEGSTKQASACHTTMSALHAAPAGRGGSSRVWVWVAHAPAHT